MYFDKNN